MVGVLIMCCVGCSGVNLSGTVSPASFFMPGLTRARPQPDEHRGSSCSSQLSANVLPVKQD